jgi:hypothetical protein
LSKTPANEEITKSKETPKEIGSKKEIPKQRGKKDK